MDNPHPPARAGSATAPPGESALGFERVVFFSDAVFAIVITLLVLPLTAEVNPPEGAGGMAAAVWARWPTVLTFVVSFLVVGQFWIAHHRTFGLIDRHDQTLVWLNLLLLLTVAFMPFPAAVLGARANGADAFPVVFYAVSMTLTSAALTAVWLYASRRRLVADRVLPSQVHAVTQRSVVATCVLVVSIPAALLGLPVALVFWLGVLPVARAVATRRALGSGAADRHRTPG
jgi:uncharacterized membrane protein